MADLHSRLVDQRDCYHTGRQNENLQNGCHVAVEGSLNVVVDIAAAAAEVPDNYLVVDTVGCAEGDHRAEGGHRTEDWIRIVVAGVADFGAGLHKRAAEGYLARRRMDYRHTVGWCFGLLVGCVEVEENTLCAMDH